MKASIAPQTILHPHPVLVVGTYDGNGKANIMTAAWGGICCSKPPCVAVSLRKATYSYGCIRAKKAFTVNIPSERHVREADYAGIASGRETDKFKAAGLTAVRSDLVEAPYVEEFPFALECRLLHEIEIGLHTQFIGEIVGIKASEDVLGPNRLPDIEKVRPILFGSGGGSAYFGIGAKVGDAFSAGMALKG